MQRIALTCLCLALSGCGYNTWYNPPFTTGSNPNFPAGDSENMRRVLGEQVDLPVLTTEPGDVWPGPLPPEPTLQDLQQQAGQAPLSTPGSTQFQAQPPSMPPPLPSRGSSTPPPTGQPAPPPPPRSGAPQATIPPSPPNPAGQVLPTQRGPAVTNGGTSGYQTTTTPGGGSAIVVPNGNGTSTIIHSDGTIETVPTPR